MAQFAAHDDGNIDCSGHTDSHHCTIIILQNALQL